MHKLFLSSVNEGTYISYVDKIMNYEIIIFHDFEIESGIDRNRSEWIRIGSRGLSPSWW